MDCCPRIIPSFPCLFHLLLLLCSLVSASPSSPNYGCEKVSLSVYYESLCPDSVKFIVDNLIELFEGDLLSIVDLRFVPYGNARLDRNSSITCQVCLYIIIRILCFFWNENSQIKKKIAGLGRRVIVRLRNQNNLGFWLLVDMI